MGKNNIYIYVSNSNQDRNLKNVSSPPLSNIIDDGLTGNVSQEKQPKVR